LSATQGSPVTQAVLVWRRLCRFAERRFAVACPNPPERSFVSAQYHRRKTPHTGTASCHRVAEAWAPNKSDRKNQKMVLSKVPGLGKAMRAPKRFPARVFNLEQTHPREYALTDAWGFKRTLGVPLTTRGRKWKSRKRFRRGGHPWRFALQAA